MATKKIKETPEYYTLEPIEKINAVYNIIFGVRSFGKTYALTDKFLLEHWNGRKNHELKQGVIF